MAQSRCNVSLIDDLRVIARFKPVEAIRLEKLSERASLTLVFRSFSKPFGTLLAPQANSRPGARRKGSEMKLRLIAYLIAAAMAGTMNTAGYAQQLIGNFAEANITMEGIVFRGGEVTLSCRRNP